MLGTDTSFLLSLYRRAVHSGTAKARLATLGQPLLLHALNLFELGNALRLAEFRELLPAGHAVKCLDALAKDQSLGLWRESEIPLDDIVAEADRLSTSHTLIGGHRAFDILHVAHARLAKVKLFLSFDSKQLQLAKSVGLRC